MLGKFAAIIGPALMAVVGLAARQALDAGITDGTADERNWPARNPLEHGFSGDPVCYRDDPAALCR